MMYLHISMYLHMPHSTQGHKVTKPQVLGILPLSPLIWWFVWPKGVGGPIEVPVEVAIWDPIWMRFWHLICERFVVRFCVVMPAMYRNSLGACQPSQSYRVCSHPCIHDARVCLLVWPSLPNTSNLDVGCSSIPHISLRCNERLSWHHFGLPDAWLLRDRHMQGPKGVALLTKRHPWSAARYGDSYLVLKVEWFDWCREMTSTISDYRRKILFFSIW